MKNVADIYALSPMQQLMLLHVKTTRRTHDVLFNQIVYQINGALNAAAYRRAWQLVVDRHPALRTMFVWQDGKDPLQVVREEVPLPWIEHDWQDLPAAEQEKELDKLLDADRALGFDLLHAPLMRIHLLRMDDLDYRLVWSSHHLIIDRWCIGIIFEELKSAYEAYTASRIPDLAPAPRYRDYIAWLAAQDAAAPQDYWRETLHDLRARPLALQPVAADEMADLDVVKVSLEGKDWDALRRFALESSVTPSTLVTGAWALVLGAATGADASLFGLTVSGRPADLAEVGRTVGSFINNVPLYVALDGDQPLAAWLQALQNQQLDLQPHEYASLAQIQAWSDLKTKSPLFDTLLVLQAPVQTAVPTDLTVDTVRGGMQTGYPISLGAVPGQNDLRLALNYDRRRVSQEMIGQIATSLQRIFLAMPADQGTLLHHVRAQARIDAPVEQETAVNGSVENNTRRYIPPQTVFEQRLARIWAEALGLPRVSIEDKFYELGGDSIKALRLFTLIEQQMGKKVPISMLFGDPSLAQMAQAIGKIEEGLPKSPVLVPLNKEGTRPPIFFIHGVSGSLVWLTNVLPLLEPDQPAYGLQSFGLQPGSEPDISIEAMAKRYLEAIRRVQPTGPYHLGGFCFGGVVAYEIARQLEILGERTALLAIVDGFPPGILANKRPYFDPFRLRIIRESAPYWVQGYEEFGGLRLRERILSKFGRGHGPQRNTNQQNTYNDPDGIVDLEYLADYAATGREIRYQIEEIHYRAADAYVPQPYNSGVTLFYARLQGVRQALFGPVDPQRGWGSLAKSGVSIRFVEGSHVGLLRSPHVSDLAAQLNDALRTAMAANQ